MSKIELLHGDCYELIKDIPDKSIDLVYIDIPYDYESGGKGGNVPYITSTDYHTKIDKFSYGIDYSIFDELCRVLRHIYIYMVF